MNLGNILFSYFISFSSLSLYFMQPVYIFKGSLVVASAVVIQSWQLQRRRPRPGRSCALRASLLAAGLRAGAGPAEATPGDAGAADC